ncbi:bacterial proteasome activator family protein [Brevibacterium sp. JSBI002]|uniref:bacterial proteasome activator family protein n=1 Tax=Brevibacterium sp. JSBI002 TaxID=2886045 RepID=UPI00222E3176|nr:bacterial proteasome activator family protein [Brevibacterium sp. JSBI002]UZD61916.1 bacterial proteasome activator family protein [Brevibacterium sp. JSBI002]
MTENPVSADGVQSGSDATGTADAANTHEAENANGVSNADGVQAGLAKPQHDQADVSSPAKVMRIGTMVKQLLDEVRGTELDEKGRERLAEIHRRSIDELEEGLSKDLIEELERLDLPFDSADGPPTTSELRIAQAQLVGWLEGLFHGIQTAIMAQQAMAQQMAGRGQLPPGMVPPGMTPADGQPGEKTKSDRDDRGTGNYL